MCLSPVKRIKRSHSCRLRSYHASAADIIAIAPKSSGKMEKAPCCGVCCLPFRPSSAVVRLGFLGVLLQKFCLVHHLRVSASTPITGCVGKQGNGMDGWKVTERRDWVWAFWVSQLIRSTAEAELSDHSQRWGGRPHMIRSPRMALPQNDYSC